MDVCSPYGYENCYKYRATNGNTFSMGGELYSNGLCFEMGGYALFNLDGEYSSIDCTIGHYKQIGYAKSVTFLVDGKEVKTVHIDAESVPVKVSVPLNYGLQLKIVSNSGSANLTGIGVANMIVH